MQTEYYVPPELPNAKSLIQEYKTLHAITGGNFEELLNVPTRVTGKNPPKPRKSFKDMNLNKNILETLEKSGYINPTPVQENAIPALLENRDVMACSQTGSGKTAAYLLPILNKLIELEVPVVARIPAVPKALILAPVRELAVQIAKECKMYSNNSKLKVRVVYGGTACKAEIYVLEGGCNILIATPGRLLQLLEEKKVNLKEAIYFVLDEADRMLDLGFIRDVKRIVSYLPPMHKRTSAMFSATFPTQVQKAADSFLENYIFVAVGVIGGASVDVHQTFHLVERAEKCRKVLDVLQDITHEEKVLIFCSTRGGVDILTAAINEQGLSAIGIHGEKFQREREILLRDFILGTQKVLIATSVAARGLDIPKVTLVINYDLPTDIEDYIHRIGRTGRVGHFGRAINFFEYHTDGVLAKKYISVLRNAKQLVPTWMEEINTCQDGSAATEPLSNLFPSRDYRLSNAIGTGRFGMPLPCEHHEDSWD